MAIESATPPRTRRRRRRGRARALLLAGMVLAAALIVAGLIVPYSLYRQIGDAGVDLDALADRPAKSAAAERAVDVAVLGTVDDRCVSLMVFHINSDRRQAAFVSVPDSPVCGAGAARLGPGDSQRVAQQLETSSDVHLDHLVILNWDAVAGLDAVVHGVEVRLDGPAYLPWPNEYQTITQQNLEEFVGYPIAAADQEPVRMRKQQLVLENVLRATLHQEMRKEPWVLYHFLDVVTDHLALDADWSWFDLSRLAVSLRDMRSNDITFHTADPSSAGAVWNSVRGDTIGAG